MTYRELRLPDDMPGQLFLSAMPGRDTPFDADQAQIVAGGIDTVIGLTPLEEIRYKSPEYAKAIEAGRLPWQQRLFPIDDFGIPHDREAYLALIRETADLLREGHKVLIHCAAGIGRTGMTATCILLALGVQYGQARSAVRALGSGAEVEEQQALIAWVARALAAD